jgi:hydrogenase maturation factor
MSIEQPEKTAPPMASSQAMKEKSGQRVMNNRLSGKIVEIYVSEGSTKGKILVDGSYLHVPLFLIMNARVGDHVLIDAGIAIRKIEKNPSVAHVV